MPIIATAAETCSKEIIRHGKLQMTMIKILPFKGTNEKVSNLKFIFQLQYYQ